MLGFRGIGRGIGRLTKNRGSVVVQTCRGASTTRSGVGESKVGRKARITFYKFELEFFSLTPNVSFSGSLHFSQNRVNMLNFRTLTSLACLTYFAFRGGNVQTRGSQLRDIISKREVLYVGGRYTNITASLGSNQFYMYLRFSNRTMSLILHQWLW